MNRLIVEAVELEKLFAPAPPHWSEKLDAEEACCRAAGMLRASDLANGKWREAKKKALFDYLEEQGE